MCPEQGCTYEAHTTDVQRYADAAMYRAEPMEKTEHGVQPKVYLLGMTADPLGHIASACKMYKGEVVRNLADVTDEERRAFFEQVQKTHLQAPFEFVDFHFLIEGVTRAFTHQMVRQRTAVYAQESLRFAVKEDAGEAVALPPSLMWANEPSEHLPPEWDHRSTYTVGDHIVETAELEGILPGSGKFDLLPAHHRDYLTWRYAVSQVSNAYRRLVEGGRIPAEDARGLLPHSITTRLHYKTNLRNLMEHAGNRLCTQAQFEWRTVWIQIVQAIRGGYEQDYRWQNLAMFTDGPVGEGIRAEYELLANLFRPICYLTGKCEFRADFDRACTIRQRVDANAEIGRSSGEWDTALDEVEGNPIVAGVGPQSVVRNEQSRPVFIGAIHPAEWLADPRAAIS